MKEAFSKEYFYSMEKILNSKLNAVILIQATNLRLVVLIKYKFWSIIKWRKDELKKVNNKTRMQHTIQRTSPNVWEPAIVENS